MTGSDASNQISITQYLLDYKNFIVVNMFFLHKYFGFINTKIPFYF